MAEEPSEPPTAEEISTPESPAAEEISTPESPPSEKFDVIYSCLRCGTQVPNSELSRLPEIKCICGFRVFIKVRTPIVKTIKAI